MQRESLKIRCLGTTWHGCSRRLLMLQFEMVTEQWNSPKKPSDFPMAKIRAIYERSQLQALKVDVSARRKKLLGGRCEQQSSCTTALWSTRFTMKSHSTSSGFHVISSNGP